MPRFFYTENNHRQYRSPDNFWRKFLKYRQKKKTEIALKNIKKLDNPYQQKASSTIKLSARPFRLAILFLIIGGWFALIIYLPFFQITSISYNGLETIRESEIKTVVNNYLNSRQWLPTKNFFIARPKTLIKKIREAFSIQTATVNKIFPNSLNINITEKISSVIYDNGTKYYLLDRGGLIIKLLKTVKTDNEDTEKITTTSADIDSAKNITSDSPPVTIDNTSTTPHEPDYLNIKKEFGNYPIIYYLSDEQEIAGQIILKPEVIQTILNISEQFEQQGIGEIKYFTINNPSSGLTAEMYKNPTKIHLSVYGDLENQINNIKIVLQSHRPKEYIDVRYGERVYWK